MMTPIPILSPSGASLRLEEVKSKYLQLDTLRDSYATMLASTEAKVINLEGESEILARVSDLFRVLIDKEVINNVRTVESLLTEGLQAVFDDLDLSVSSEISVKRGKVSVELSTVQKLPDGTVTEGSCIDSCGGSIATVESVLLRIVVVNRRGMRPLLLLDESLAAVSEHYVPRVGTFLSLLCDRLGMDILSVTHNPALVEAADTAYKIKNSGGRATFRKLGNT